MYRQWCVKPGRCKLQSPYPWSLVFKPFLIRSWKNYFRKVARELPWHILFPRKTLPEVKFDTVAAARRQGSIPKMNEPGKIWVWQALSGLPGWVPHMSTRTCSYRCSCGGSSQTVPPHRRVYPRKESGSRNSNTQRAQVREGLQRRLRNSGSRIWRRVGSKTVGSFGKYQQEKRWQTQDSWE